MAEERLDRKGSYWTSSIELRAPILGGSELRGMVHVHSIWHSRPCDHVHASKCTTYLYLNAWGVRIWLEGPPVHANKEGWTPRLVVKQRVLRGGHAVLSTGPARMRPHGLPAGHKQDRRCVFLSYVAH